MADNERNEPGASPDATTPPNGTPIPGPPPAVRPSNPTEVTPEQVRQFQEFQRFQELMKQQGETPGQLPWGPPPPKESLPKRLLKGAISKILTGVVVLVVLIAAGYFAINHFLGPDLDKPTASQTGGEKTKATLLFEESPALAVRKIYDDIAQGDGTYACTRFEPAARDQFTKNMSEYGNTCEDIVETIHTAVVADRMKNEYANPWIPASAAPIEGDTATVSSCAIEVTGGPRLGRFTLREIPESKQGGKPQWIVSAHEAEPADCAGLSPSTTPSN